jgi:large conductance mechanosensitive channel
MVGRPHELVRSEVRPPPRARGNLGAPFIELAPQGSSPQVRTGTSQRRRCQADLNKSGAGPHLDSVKIAAFMKRGETMIKGFKNFLMQGELIIIAVGLVVALAFSTLIKSFTDSIITPLVNAAEGGGASAQGLGWTVNGQRIELGTFISAIVYFIIFMAVIYFVLVVPYRSYMKRQGKTVFGDPAPTQTCPYCLSDDLPVSATKCKYCASELVSAS